MKTLLKNLKSIQLVVALLVIIMAGLAPQIACGPVPSVTPAARATVAPLVTPVASPRLTPTSVATPLVSVDVDQIARDIIANAGAISNVRKGDPKRVIIVFEENHASRVGQIEIAIMINRLYLRHGLKHIGLEGAMAAAGVLDASWFRPSLAAGQALGSKQEVAVQLLASGEINSAELMALVYPDVAVHGIEKAEEYPLRLSDDASNAPVFYLIAIADKSMTAEQRKKALELLDAVKKAPENEKPRKVEEFIAYAVGTNTWTKQQYEKLTDKKTTPSVEELFAILGTLETKAEEVKADLSNEDKAGLGELKSFYKARQSASDTMALNALKLAENYPGTTIAITIGSAHSKRVTELLTTKGVSFAVIKPLSLDTGDERDFLSDDAYERKQNLLSVDAEGALGQLLDNRWKPRSVLVTGWFRSDAQLKYLVVEIARAVRRGEQIPFDRTVNMLPELKYIKIDRNSFEMDDGDVIFSVEAQTGDPAKPWKKIWVRARATESARDRTLEEQLLEAREKVKEPSPAPVRGEPTLTELSRDVIAKFATDYAIIKKTKLLR